MAEIPTRPKHIFGGNKDRIVLLTEYAPEVPYKREWFTEVMPDLYDQTPNTN
jgi:hypothetical protein